MGYQCKTANPDYMAGGATDFAHATSQDIAWAVKQIQLLQANGGGIIGGLFFYGHGLPDDSLGSNGDLYLNIDTGDLYGKENGSWLS